MIRMYANYLTHSECDSVIEYYKQNPNLIFNETNEYVINYEGIEVDIDSDFILSKKFNIKNAQFVRIQKTNSTITPLTNPHTHPTPFNFIIFLNENFEGGELYIGGEYIKPKKGTMVYFTGDEEHYPTLVKNGDRYVIACFLSVDIFPNKNKLI